MVLKPAAYRIERTMTMGSATATSREHLAQARLQDECWDVFVLSTRLDQPSSGLLLGASCALGYCTQQAALSRYAIDRCYVTCCMAVTLIACRCSAPIIF